MADLYTRALGASPLMLPVPSSKGTGAYMA